MVVPDFRHAPAMAPAINPSRLGDNGEQRDGRASLAEASNLEVGVPIPASTPINAFNSCRAMGCHRRCRQRITSRTVRRRRRRRASNTVCRSVCTMPTSSDQDLSPAAVPISTPTSRSSRSSFLYGMLIRYMLLAFPQPQGAGAKQQQRVAAMLAWCSQALAGFSAWRAAFPPARPQIVPCQIQGFEAETQRQQRRSAGLSPGERDLRARMMVVITASRPVRSACSRQGEHLRVSGGTETVSSTRRRATECYSGEQREPQRAAYGRGRSAICGRLFYPSGGEKLADPECRSPLPVKEQANQRRRTLTSV